VRTFIVFVVGFGSGWAIRSLADSSHGVGVTLLAAAHDARERLGHWYAEERERLEDMMAEARSDARHGGARTHPFRNGAATGRPVHRARP